MDNKLKTLTYEQKQTYLIDCLGYGLEDFEWLWEQWLDNIIIDNNYAQDCLNFNS